MTTITSACAILHEDAREVVARAGQADREPAKPASSIDDVPCLWPLSILRSSWRLALLSCMLAVLAAGLAPSASSASATGPIVVVKLNTDLDRVSDGFLKGALKHAAKEDARLVVIEINTPGGLIDEPLTGAPPSTTFIQAPSLCTVCTKPSATFCRVVAIRVAKPGLEDLGRVRRSVVHTH